MSLIEDNKWYKRYKDEVKRGKLDLPVLEIDVNQNIRLYYGEVFCRYEDCVKNRAAFSTTNNLRSHLRDQHDCKLEKSKGGRNAYKTVNLAIQWYKGLFSERDAHQPVAHENEHEAVQEQIINDLQAQSESELSAALPSLPCKKDGTVHISNMRKKVKELGHTLPCNKCSSAKDCCKDQKTCEHFHHFYYELEDEVEE